MENRCHLILEDESLSYEEKIAEVISIELNTAQRVSIVKRAIERAKNNYGFRDVNNVFDWKYFSDRVIGFTKTLGVGLPTLFKIIKSEIRTPSVDSINQENYLQNLYDLLQDSGEINEASLKGFLLKKLFNNSYTVIPKYFYIFNDMYDKKEVNLKLLWSLVSLKLLEAIKPQVINDSNISPQNKTTFSNGSQV